MTEREAPMTERDPQVMGATVLVTGGTGGLGRAVTEVFLTRGWRVVAPHRPGRELDGPGERERLLLVDADLLDPGGVGRAVEAAASDERAPLRAVVNLVGGYAGGTPLHETPPEEFERMLTLNLRPTFLVTRASIPHLLAGGGGAIVCVSSRAAVRPFGRAAGYVTAKAAVLAFAQAVAAEYRGQGIRCNAVLPSVIDTPANRADQPDADHSRWVAPAEVARVIHFFCVDESRPTSGAAIPVYGLA
ncbi:MAG TPA: SDR family NAD(P)-dependent oxidoreductase [Actinomycetes bacterium]|jgi:NAD(P)-dependent dehydrogenase (short-subunit alcohol dehydrogenase family)|nr:SDR family NAD(P)-dependent oxidoreductase [Actinomycetes bacterium]